MEGMVHGEAREFLSAPLCSLHPEAAPCARQPSALLTMRTLPAPLGSTCTPPSTCNPPSCMSPLKRTPPSLYLQMPHMHVDPLAALLKKYITTINLKRGQVLFRQGDTMAGLYIVESGEGVGEEVHHHQPQRGADPDQAGRCDGRPVHRRVETSSLPPHPRPLALPLQAPQYCQRSVGRPCLSLTFPLPVSNSSALPPFAPLRQAAPLHRAPTRGHWHCHFRPLSTASAQRAIRAQPRPIYHGRC